MTQHEEPNPSQEVDAAPETQAEKAEPAESPEATETPPKKKSKASLALARPGRGDWRPPLIAAGVFTLLAIVFLFIHTWQNAEKGKLVAGLIASAHLLVNVALRTAMGVAAVAAVAKLLDAPLGKIGLAAARMALAVCLFFAVYQLVVLLDPTGIGFWNWAIGGAIGGACYYVMIWWAFSLDRSAAALVAGTHFILWLAVKVGVLLEIEVANRLVG